MADGSAGAPPDDSEDQRVKPERPGATGAPPGTGRGSPLLALLVLVLLAAGCGHGPAPRSHQLQGTYIVHGAFRHRAYGAACSPAEAGYPDIHVGTPVTVKDGAGALLGSPALDGGTLRKGALDDRTDDCVFWFSLSVPERDAYRIEVARRGAVPFQRSELERSNWQADLTIGAYTMFGGI
jgi:hypothetical protein